MGRSRHDAYTSLGRQFITNETRTSRDSSTSSSSSRNASSSQMGLLTLDEKMPPLTRRFPSLSYALRRRRYSRYFTLFLTALVLGIILLLTHLKTLSEADIRLGKSKAKPGPPPWESFLFLKRYHGGVRTLVPRTENKPEYPDAGKQLEIGGKAESKDADKHKPASGDERKVNDDAEGKQSQSDRGRDGVEHKADNKDEADRQGAPTPGQQQSQALDPASLKEKPQVDDDDRPNPFRKRVAFHPTDPIRIQRKLAPWPIEPCFLDKKDEVAVPPLQVHKGVPKGFPDPVMGSYDLLGLDHSVCFDRYGRLGPYGLGYSRAYGGSGAGMEGEGVDEAMHAVWGESFEVDYLKVDWADAQTRCLAKNRKRYSELDLPPAQSFRDMGAPKGKQETKNDRNQPRADDKAKQGSKKDDKSLPRSAVLVRTWHGYEYDEEDKMYLRSLINEVSLFTGGEYAVHILVHVKDVDLQIWADQAVYDRVLAEALPEEFRGLGVLWSERQMGLIYSGLTETNYRDLPIMGVYRSTYLPVQYFAHTHPEYDYFWHWEMDSRYIGHYYDLFEKLATWAKEQPRKGLWERNSRFYVPSEHGSWEEFLQMVRVQSQHGTNSRDNMYNKQKDDAAQVAETPIWGPQRPIMEKDHFETDRDVLSPRLFAEDKYDWGVGEEADFITLNPLFDPDQTTWILGDDVTGYNTSQGLPPRRTAIITASRLSRRLLETMHRETAIGRHSMFSEMWPGSCALHHGYKAVYAPHPVYIDRRWPTSYLAAIFNNGRNGASGGARTSVFSDERQHNFLGTTWYYHAGFPGNLWKRWLGYRVDNDGGEEQEKAGEGRMCLPSMLLHPVKHVDLIYEH